MENENMQYIPACSYGKTPLTREYFENNNWEIKISEPDKDGFIMWEAFLYVPCEKCGARLELSVTNCMYDWRFSLSGEANGDGEGYFYGKIFVCTVEELETFLFDIVHILWDYRKNEPIEQTTYDGSHNIKIK